MIFPAIFASFFLGIFTVNGAAFNATRSICGTHISDSNLVAAEAHFAAHRITSKEGDISPKAAAIKVYFHVISADSTYNGGNVLDSQIADQISTMNMDFAGTGISWVLAGTTRTINSNWFVNAGPDINNPNSPGNTAQTDMKRELRQGGVADLNVYSVGFVALQFNGLLGYATFPSSYNSAPWNDGIVFLYSAISGGTTVDYTIGTTLVHEAGHWVGLYHTFQGGCSGVGDMVADTAPEAEPAFGCRIGRDTCPGGDTDPVINFMDYSVDACKSIFTSGQAARARSQLLTYRGI